jgi:hypothetical protein
MRTRNKASLIAVAALSVALSGCQSKTGTAPTPQGRAETSAGSQGSGSTVAPPAAGGSCHVRPGPLPDPACTPGVVNPNVNQGNIKDTVCKSGWTATIRPPASYTNKLKTQGIAAYGYTDTNPRSYEEDHLISLELGGSPDDAKNLWPEPGASPNAKDKIENDLKAAVCSGRVQLTAAQQAIATDWTTAEKVVGIG